MLSATGIPKVDVPVIRHQPAERFISEKSTFLWCSVVFPLNLGVLIPSVTWHTAEWSLNQ